MCLYSSSYWKTNEKKKKKLEQKEYQSYANIPVRYIQLYCHCLSIAFEGRRNSSEKKKKKKETGRKRRRKKQCHRLYRWISGSVVPFFFFFHPLSFVFRHNRRHELLCVLCFVLFRSSPLMTFRNLHVNFNETVEELFCLWTTAIT